MAIAAACTPAASTRPTDPHLVVTDAVRATAALTSLRLHMEMVTTRDGSAFGEPGTSTDSTTLDADVDLAGRQLAGRATTQTSRPAGQGVPGGPQTADVIVTNAATFIRQGGDARWTKVGNAGIPAEPTNVALAAALVGLLDDPRVTYDRADPVECTLGRCDHVIVHVDGAAAIAALSLLVGAPADASATFPDVDVDVRVSQATSVISELRLSFAVVGQSAQVLITLASPGDPVQIVAPAPALVDDNLGGVPGGGGIQPAPTAPPVPVPAEPESPAP
jgi:hypothetical protein